MSVFDTTNEYASWPASKFQEPRQVEHGIKLKKSIQEIAGNWWSQRWFKIIDEFGLGVRWERAKLYAALGQVLSIEIENGLVKASVQGSDDEPYRVMVSVKTIPKPIWTAILQDLGKTSSFAIGLASGTFPAEEQISRVFQANGVLLFPDRQGELHTKCTCLDWSNPCKHVAAVYLLIGAEFDRDPFLLFKLRGLEHNEFFKLATPTGLIEQSQTGSEVLSASEDHQSGSIARWQSTPEAGLDVSDSFNSENHAGFQSTDKTYFSDKDYVRQFWRTAIFDSQILGQCNLHTQLASLPASLGEFPFWQGEENFLDRIRCAYETAPEYAKTVLVKRNSLF